MNKRKITIIGAGVSGLSTGYYAKRFSIPFKIFEESDCIGGSSQTIKRRDFYFDSGAHRFHDKNYKVTSFVKDLLGENLLTVDKPTQIFYNGRFIDFPLSPLNLLRNLGIINFSIITFQIVFHKLKNIKGSNFRDYVIGKYGKILASKFLLNYSQKLWGLPCEKLSQDVAGKRLVGMDFKTLLFELIFGKKMKTKHLDGVFYYPKYGIGMIADTLANKCGIENIQTTAKLTAVFHKNSHITKIQINNNEVVNIDLLASTIPITSFLAMMDPCPPDNITDIAKGLKFRNIKLAIIFLNKPCVTKSATIHFPDINVPFTRVFEPRNRSVLMSPKGKTSVVVEFPCDKSDIPSDEKILSCAIKTLTDIKLFDEKDIIDTCVYNIPDAYPVLELGFEKKINTVFEYLRSIDNLYISGRSGLFKYSGIHDQINSSKEIIDEILSTFGEKS